MNKSDLETLFRAGALAASAVSPGVGFVADFVLFAIKQADLAMREGTITAEELKEIKARAKVADARWDEVVKKAQAGGDT